MHIKDHNDAMKFFRTYDNVASKGKWKEFVDEMEFDSMLQEPRTMAQEPRIELATGSVSGDKAEFSKAWKDYNKSYRFSGPKGIKHRLSGAEFFKIWAKENMAEGGSAGQLVQNTADGSRPGYSGKYVKKGYEASKWKDLPKKDPEFKKWLKENKITDFDTTTARKDIVKKYQIATTKKNYIKSGDLAKILSDAGSPYQPNGLRDQFAFAKRKLGNDAAINAKIKKSKRIVKIINDSLGDQFSLADTRKGQSVLEGLPIHHADDSRYFKKGKDFNKQLKKVVEGLTKEYDTTGLRTNTIDNIFNLYKDEKFMKELNNYKGGKVDPKSYLFKKAFANNESAYAFMQLGRVRKGELELEGITSNKHQGNKIIKSMAFDAKGKKYGSMWKASYEYAKLQLSPYMKTKNSYAGLTGVIKNAFKEAGVIGKDIDEIFPLRTGTFTLKKGSDAYSNFIQVIDSKINQGAKVQFDRIASGTSQSIIKELADAKKTGDYSKVEDLVEKHNKRIEEFYTDNPKAKNVKLQEFPWDSRNKRFLKPKEVFESQYNALKGDYKTIPSEIRKGMEQFHRETGLSINPGTRTTLEKSAQELQEVAGNPKKQMEILKRMGYRCLKASGAGEDVACYMDDVKKTRADMKSPNVEVRAKALTKQRTALQLAGKIPQLKKILKTGVQLGTAAITKPLQALGLTSGIGYAIEGIVEGGFYDNARRKGYSHEQAMAETFTPGLIAGRPHDVPWYGGAEKLREKELYTQTDPREFVYFDGKEFKNPNFGKPTGKIDSKVLQYVDALKEQDRIYSAIGKKERLKGQEIHDPTGVVAQEQLKAAADVQDLARSGAYGRVDRTLRPESMASQAYNTVVEKRDALDQKRRKEYLEKVEPAFLEREQKSFDTKRHREKRYKKMEEYKRDREGIFGGMSRKEYEDFQEKYPELKNRAYEDVPKWLQYLSTLEAKPEGFDKTYKELFPTPASRYDWDLMGEIARAGGVANMAEGGIMNLKKKW